MLQITWTSTSEIDWQTTTEYINKDKTTLFKLITKREQNCLSQISLPSLLTLPMTNIHNCCKLQTHLNPPQNGENTKRETTHVAGICFSTLFTNGTKHQKWIIDSGASIHICHEKSMFRTLCKVENFSMLLPTKQD